MPVARFAPGTAVPERRTTLPIAGWDMQDDAEGRAGLNTTPITGGSCLRIDLAEHGTTALVVLAGELDLDSAPQLRSALERVVARGGEDIVVDVAGLRFCGAIGMGILVATAQGLPSGGALTLAGATGMLRRLLHVTGVDELVRLGPAAVSRRPGPTRPPRRRRAPGGRRRRPPS